MLGGNFIVFVCAFAGFFFGRFPGAAPLRTDFFRTPAGAAVVLLYSMERDRTGAGGSERFEADHLGKETTNRAGRSNKSANTLFRWRTMACEVCL